MSPLWCHKGRRQQEATGYKQRLKRTRQDKRPKGIHRQTSTQRYSCRLYHKDAWAAAVTFFFFSLAPNSAREAARGALFPRSFFSTGNSADESDKAELRDGVKRVWRTRQPGDSELNMNSHGGLTPQVGGPVCSKTDTGHKKPPPHPRRTRQMR